jgi:hypothetical protein
VSVIDSYAQMFISMSRSFLYYLFSTGEMFDVLFICCTVVCVSGLSLSQTRQRWIIHKIFKSKTLSSKASVLDACCTYFLYLSVGLHACIHV